MACFQKPVALFPDIYRESALPKADPKLRPGDQSVLLLCQVLQGMAKLSALEDGTTQNWRYGDLSLTACYVLQGLKCHTEVSNTMVSTFFLAALLIRHADEVLRAALETCEEVQKESNANDTMGSGCSDIDTSTMTPVMPWSMCASDIDFFDIVCMDTESRLDTESSLDTNV